MDYLENFTEQDKQGTIMINENRKQELLEAIKCNLALKPNSFAIFIRSIPWLYSFYLKIRVFTSINICTRQGELI